MTAEASVPIALEFNFKNNHLEMVTWWSSIFLAQYTGNRAALPIHTGQCPRVLSVHSEEGSSPSEQKPGCRSHYRDWAVTMGQVLGWGTLLPCSCDPKQRPSPKSGLLVRYKDVHVQNSSPQNSGSPWFTLHRRNAKRQRTKYGKGAIFPHGWQTFPLCMTELTQ